MGIQNKAPTPLAGGSEGKRNSNNGADLTPGESAHKCLSASFPIVVAEWDRNSREVVRVALDLYNGRHTINARIWFHGDDGLRPGKSGLTLSVKHLPALAEALLQAEHRARALGIIDGGEQ